MFLTLGADAFVRRAHLRLPSERVNPCKSRLLTATSFYPTICVHSVLLFFQLA